MIFLFSNKCISMTLFAAQIDNEYYQVDKKKTSSIIRCKRFIKNEEIFTFFSFNKNENLRWCS